VAIVEIETGYTSEGCIDDSRVAARVSTLRGERRPRGLAEALLINAKNIILQCDNDLLVIPEAEVVLNDKVFIFLDFILVHLTFLHFRKVPGNDVLPGRSHNRVFLLSWLE